MSQQKLNRIAIIGMGLIGGSIAKGLKAHDPSIDIAGMDVDADTLALMQSEGAIDHGYTLLADALNASYDGIIIATSAAYWKDIAEALQHASLEGIQFIMDVGSIKSYAIECFGALPHYVPAHPIAGSQFSGGIYSTGELFQQKRVILTTSDNGSAEAQTLVQALWEHLGAHCTTLDAASHDTIYAYVSHLPQLCAYAVAQATLPKLRADEPYLNWLRLAGSSPDMWLSIFRYNPAMAQAAQHFLQLINHMLTELRVGTLEGDVPVDMTLAAKLSPRIIASCLIGTLSVQEKQLDIPMASYAGSGFADMTHPAMTEPEDDLALISEHTNAVVSLLESCESTFRSLCLSIMQEQWQALDQQIGEAQAVYMKQLETLS